jgi:hypothetical protein
MAGGGSDGVSGSDRERGHSCPPVGTFPDDKSVVAP